jgi:PKD repeat protein
MLKFLRNYLLAFLWVFFLGSTSHLRATHIIGGDLTYRCLGNNLYEITLILRRDCINGQPPFDNPASVGIFDSSGVLQTNLGKSGRLAMTFHPDDTLNEILKKNCGIIGGDVCVHTTTYRETLYLPYKDGGYILAYQRCCRNKTIQNIGSPLDVGTTYALMISDEALNVCNSSPSLSPYPPIYVCGGHPIQFNLQAHDAEGDSLVYAMCDPYSGASQANPQPAIPSPPPYLPVTFLAPYSTKDMIGGIPPLQIDSHTGLMTGFAVNIVAQYLVAYCVQEYRNGKLLSTIRRDFQINVRICNSVPEADFDYTLDPCAFPVMLKIKDKSTDAFSVIDSWNWENVLHSLKQNSIEQNPVFQFTDTGIAKIRLVVHSRESCSDTLTRDIRIRSVRPVFDSVSFTICLGDSIQLVKTYDAMVKYKWFPSSGLSCLNCPNPKASPDSTIRYVVTSSDAACMRVDTIPVFVHVCDTCAFNIRKTCLQNGMIEIAALNIYGKLIQPVPRIHELFWSVKKNSNYPEISLINKNPVLLNADREFSLSSKIYSWKPGLPRSIEFADICKRDVTDSTNLSCSGPCAELNFILSSCEDDYDLANNLNFPSAICQSICSNACNYIIALFETDGSLINPANYRIKWSTGGSGAYVMMMGPYYNTLTVEVQKGDCIWYGRYWKSCKNDVGHFNPEIPGLNMMNTTISGFSNLQAMIQNSETILIYDLNGQLISNNKNQIEELEPGVYFLKTGTGTNQRLLKFIR